MGQKINPNVFRLIYKKKCSIWFENFKNYSYFLKKDNQILTFLKLKIEEFAINKIKIKRETIHKRVMIHIHTQYPALIYKNKSILKTLTLNQKSYLKSNELVLIKIFKIQNFNTKINLLTFIISKQIQARITFPRIIQVILSKTKDINLKGLKIQISGRLNGIEKAKTEWYKQGSIPLNTLMTKIEYTSKNIITKYGSIGIKIWLVNR